MFLPDEIRKEAERELRRAVPLADWWRGEPGVELARLRDRAWWACAGLAQPQAFFAALQAQGLDLARTLPLACRPSWPTPPLTA